VKVTNGWKSAFKGNRLGQMPEPKIILQLPIEDRSSLSAFVEKCLLEKASLIAIVGNGCAETEDEIDGLIVGDGADDSRFITTTSHPDETLEEVIEFASWWGDADAPTRVIRL